MDPTGVWTLDLQRNKNMSRWYRSDEENRGYEAQQAHDHRSEWDGNHEYRQGWIDGERDDRREREQREEQRQQEEARERAEERRRHEEYMRSQEDEPQYDERQQQQPEQEP